MKITYNNITIEFDKLLSNSFSHGEIVDLYLGGENVAKILLSKSQLNKLNTLILNKKL